MGSLTGSLGSSIKLDKLVHGIGDVLLGMLVIISLPPKRYTPALAGIVLAGVGLDFAESTMGRNAEMIWEECDQGSRNH